MGRLVPLDGLLGTLADRRVKVPVQGAVVAPVVLDPFLGGVGVQMLSPDSRSSRDAPLFRTHAVL